MGPSNIARGVVIATLFLAGSASAQQQPLVPYEGTQGFRQYLSWAGLKPVATQDEFLEHNPSESVLIVFGDFEPLKKFPLISYHQQGGAMLLAGSGLLPDAYRVRIQKEIAKGGAQAFAQSEECPLFVSTPHPLFQGVANNLAGNRQHVMYFDVPMKRRPYDIETHYQNRPQFLAMVADSRPAPCMILPGEGVFINCMLAQPHLGNFRFTENTILWLTEQKKRKHLLFFEQGEVVEELDVPLTTLPPLPPIPDVPAQLINKAIDQFQREQFLNRALDRLFGREVILRIALVGATFIALFLAARALMRTRRNQDLAAPLIVDRLEPVPMQPRAFEQRTQAMLTANDFREPAVTLARHWFWKHAGIDPAAWEREAVKRPRMPFKGSWWQRYQARKRLKRLYLLARLDRDAVVDRSDFETLQRDLNEFPSPSLA